MSWTRVRSDDESNFLAAANFSERWKNKPGTLLFHHIFSLSRLYIIRPLPAGLGVIFSFFANVFFKNMARNIDGSPKWWVSEGDVEGERERQFLQSPHTIGSVKEESGLLSQNLPNLRENYLKKILESYWGGANDVRSWKNIKIMN